MTEIQNLFQAYSDGLFKALQPQENLILQMKGEDSLFLRWNKGKVRQSTRVRQFEIQWTYQSQDRQLEVSQQLTLNLDQDLRRGEEHLSRLREQAQILAPSHQLAPLVVGERQISVGETPKRDVAAIATEIERRTQGLDLIGFWSSGPMVRAVSNSKGLFLFESRDSFFFDYSIFTRNAAGENKAVKGFFSEPHWDATGWSERWNEQLSQLKKDLERLQISSRRLNSGKYRVYLAPSAVASIIETVKFGGFSYASYKHGRSPLKEWVEGRQNFSAQFDLTENFALGFAPRFNRFGEVAPLQVPLASKGRFVTLLISGKTAREFNLPSNGAEEGHFESESPRSVELAPGRMPLKDALARLGTGVWINEVHYTNFSDIKSARLTGMTRYACFWVEQGQIISPIEDMRFDVSLYHLFGTGLLELTSERQDLLETGTYYLRHWAGSRLPGLLVEDFEFTL